MAAVTAGSLTTMPVLAECGLQTNAFPPFTEVASTARRVVIGTVVEPLRGHTGTVATFRVRVDAVLRGDAPASIAVLGIRSGLPLQGSPACRANAFLYARKGDVLAIAFGGRFDGHGGVNTAAWIEGRPRRDRVVGVETLTLAQVRRAVAGLPPTSTAALLSDSSEITSAGIWS
jgi:hypothetical protein